MTSGLISASPTKKDIIKEDWKAKLLGV